MSDACLALYVQCAESTMTIVDDKTVAMHAPATAALYKVNGLLKGTCSCSRFLHMCMHVYAHTYKHSYTKTYFDVWCVNAVVSVCTEQGGLCKCACSPSVSSSSNTTYLLYSA